MLLLLSAITASVRGIFLFMACQPEKGTQTVYNSMPVMQQQDEDLCKECTLNKRKNDSGKILVLGLVNKIQVRKEYDCVHPLFYRRCIKIGDKGSGWK
jgi:hypothetical protein